MTKQQDQRPTAKIYAFPTRTRAASAGHRRAYVPAQQQAAVAFATTEFGSAWYHEAALEEANEADDLGHQQH
jgi:hypothetical protein